jgi:hypothetical protein
MSKYKVIYLDNVKFTILFFIESLKISRKRRYIDTWLEELLLTNYFFQEIDEFYEEMFKFIEEKLNTWMVWTIQEQTKEYYTKKVILDIRSYTLVLNCKQYLKEKTIIVEDIKIDR